MDIHFVFRRKNIKWMFLCIVPVIAFIFFHPELSSHETDIYIPVIAGNIPNDLTITGTALKGIEVHVKGSSSALNKLSGLKLSYAIDLKGVHPGLNSITIDKKNIRLPGGIFILSVRPEYLTVKIEKQITKKLPVEIKYTGKPASGFFVAGAIAKPMAVTLEGPESILGPMDKIRTKPVNLNRASGSFKKEIVLDTQENIHIENFSGIILAEIFIKEVLVVKKFSDVKVQGRGSREPYLISPPAITIEVKGPLSIIEKLNGEKGLQVYVNLKGLKPGVYVRRASITLPVNTTLVQVKPELFTVRIEK